MTGPFSVAMLLVVITRGYLLWETFYLRPGDEQMSKNLCVCMCIDMYTYMYGIVMALLFRVISEQTTCISGCLDEFDVFAPERLLKKINHVLGVFEDVKLLNMVGMGIFSELECHDCDIYWCFGTCFCFPCIGNNHPN